MNVPLRGHRRIEERSLALHRAIAEKLQEHPDLLAVARDNLRRWSADQGRSQPYWDDWTRLLDLPLPELLEKIQEDSERMTALRQATPFAGVLTPSERWAIYNRFAAQHPPQL